MNIFLSDYSRSCFELNFELNHIYAQFNEKMNFQKVSARANMTQPSNFVKCHKVINIIGNMSFFGQLICCWY